MNRNFHFPLSLAFLIPDTFILYHCEFSSFSNFSSLWPTLVSTGVGVQLLSPSLGWHCTMPTTEVMSLYHLCPQSLSFLLPWSPRPWVSGAASVSAETFLSAISLMFTLMFPSYCSPTPFKQSQQSWKWCNPPFPLSHPFSVLWTAPSLCCWSQTYVLLTHFSKLDFENCFQCSGSVQGFHCSDMSC